MQKQSYEAVPYGGSQGALRWAIIDSKTGELLDNAQGYGYYSPEKAYASYSYKKRTEKVREAKEELARQWLKEHTGFRFKMNQRFNSNILQQMLDENGYDNLPFTAKDLLHVWKKG